jgi:hypothetical protein
MLARRFWGCEELLNLNLKADGTSWENSKSFQWSGPMSATLVTIHCGQLPNCPDRSAAHPNLWSRLRNAIARARARQFEREAAAYIVANGGRLTDQLERQILDRAAGLDRRGPVF